MPTTCSSTTVVVKCLRVCTCVWVCVCECVCVCVCVYVCVCVCVCNALNRRLSCHCLYHHPNPLYPTVNGWRFTSWLFGVVWRQWQTTSLISEFTMTCQRVIIWLSWQPMVIWQTVTLWSVIAERRERQRDTERERDRERERERDSYLVLCVVCVTVYHYNLSILHTNNSISLREVISDDGSCSFEFIHWVRSPCGWLDQYLKEPSRGNFNYV